jgi:cobalt-zinc-cadmium efflux system outer membrane protein
MSRTCSYTVGTTSIRNPRYYMNPLCNNVLLTISLLVIGVSAHGQADTLRLDFKQAEALFLKNNLSLLASKYNVESTQALVKQAKLWDNPTLSTDQNVHDGGTGKFFDHSEGNGQYYAQLTQLFLTAGKRGKQVQIAKDDAQIQQAEFNDLFRNLHYNLLLDFSQLSNLIAQSKIYTSEVTSLKSLITGVTKSYGVGNSSLKDMLRLKALLFGLENDMVENSRQLNDLQSQLKTLLVSDKNAYISPVMDTKVSDQALDANTLIETAKTNRGDYMSNQYQYEQAGHKLSLQKAMAIPDLTVGGEFDQHASFAPNYWGLTIALPLPVFNRNQGNIKSAKLAMQSQEATYKSSELQLQNDVISAISQYHLSTQLLSKDETDFYSQYDSLFDKMFKAYKERQLSLVEFIDFFDSYKDTKLKVINQQYNLQKAIADLNFSVGVTVINP